MAAPSGMSNHFPGTASLIDLLDRKLLAVLRDGRHLVGTLRSVDQYSNIVLDNACEQHVVNGKIGDIPLGLYVLRGDNIVILGEVDDNLEQDAGRLERVDTEAIMEAIGEAADEDTAKRRQAAWDFDKA